MILLLWGSNKKQKNGYLFESDNPKDLSRVIDLALSENSTKIRKNIKNSVREFNWSRVIARIEEIIGF